MKTRIFWVAIFAVTLCSACTQEPLVGNVYVIKGDGGITRAASIDVHVIPFSTVEDFNSARDQFNDAADKNSLTDYRQYICAALPDEKSRLIEVKSASAKVFSTSCVDEKNDWVTLQTDSLTAADIEPRIAELEKQKSTSVSQIGNELKKSAADAVELSFDYTADSFGRVLITNKSDYWLTTGVDDYPPSLAGFVEGIRVWSGRNRPKIAPMATYYVGLGQGNFTSESATLQQRGAKVCRKNDYKDVLCLDDLGIEKYNSSVAGSYEKGEWIFANRTVKETKLDPIIEYTEVNFEGIAQRTPQIKKLDNELEKLYRQVEISKESDRRRSDCETINDQITALEELSCQNISVGRVDLTKLFVEARSLGIEMDALPLGSQIGVGEFALLKSQEVLRTNIDGVFLS